MRSGNPYKLKVAFDPKYGFPDTIDYDGRKEAVDDEFYQVISDFAPGIDP